MAERTLYASESAARIEIDGIREAIRLNWVQMEYSFPSEIERHAIRANVARLVQTLVKLIAQLEPRSEL